MSKRRRHPNRKRRRANVCHVDPPHSPYLTNISASAPKVEGTTNTEPKKPSLNNGIPASIFYPLMDPTHVGPIHPGNEPGGSATNEPPPQLLLLLDRDKAPDAWKNLPEGEFLNQAQRKMLDVRNIARHPAFIFAAIYTAGAAVMQYLRIKGVKIVKEAVGTRVNYNRSLGRFYFGSSVGLMIRTDQQGVLR